MKQMSDRFATKILNKKYLTDSICEFTIEIPNDIAFHFLPGQYTHLSNPDENQFSGFSITSVPWETDQFVLTIKDIENDELTDWLFTCEAGTEVIVSKPRGEFVLKFNQEEHPVLIGGGIGITPLLSMYRTATKFAPKLSIDLFYSSSTQDELLYFDELTKIADTYENISFHPVITQENWSGKNERVTAEYIINQISTNPLVDNLEDRTFFICGPDSMNDDIRYGLENHGIDPKKIKTENFYET